MPRPRTAAVPPLVVPAGVRLVLVLPGGRELPVTFFGSAPRTAAGPCPKVARPAREEPGGLFADVAAGDMPPRAPAAIIRVYHRPGKKFEACEVNQHPWLREYPTEVREESCSSGAN